MGTSADSQPVDLRVILGDYRDALAVKSPEAALPQGITARYQDGHPIGHFRRFVTALDAEIAEIPLMTFLSALQAGVPLVLLPVVVLARYQHPFLIADSTKGLTPADLPGKRVGIRAYSVTTAVWVRDILEQEHGIDPASIEWVAFEEPHVASFTNPPNVTRAPAGATAEEMVESGALSAAVLRAVPAHGSLRPLLPDAEAAGRRWGEGHQGAVQINHMLCTTAQTATRLQAPIRAWLDALHRSSTTLGRNERSFLFGRNAVEPSLELGLACAKRQGIGPVSATAASLLQAFPYEPPLSDIPDSDR